MTDKQTLSYTGTWVMVSDRLPTQLFSDRRPDQLEIVWLHYTGKVVEGREYTATAFYVAKKFTIEADPYCEGDDELSCDFCEETELLYLKPGWYEIGLNLYKPIDGTALAWTPFPSRPVLWRLK